MLKYSIIIQTCNHLEDFLRPCLDSLLQSTNLETAEIIIVANGCTDETKDFLKLLEIQNLKILWHNLPIADFQAFNCGINASSGEYIVLFDSCNILLEWGNNNIWLNLLEEPFKQNDKMAITAGGNWQMFSSFSCSMIKRNILNKIGLLDEGFRTSISESTLYARAFQQGYRVKQVGEDGSFPIWQKTISDRQKEIYNVCRTLGDVKDKTMVEIGCFQGDSTEGFARCFKKIYAVDMWKAGYDDNDSSSHAQMEQIKSTFDSMRKHYNNIEVFHMSSEKASKLFNDHYLDFVYIDACHKYDSVKRDIELWKPKVKNGGFIGGHDYNGYCPNVVAAVNDVLGSPDNVVWYTNWIKTV